MTKKRIRAFVLTLIILIICAVFFWPMALPSVLNDSLRTATECSILRHSSTVSITVRGEELEGLIDLAAGTRIQYRGPYRFILLEPGEHTYNVLFVRRGPDTLVELGSFLLDEKGNLYIGGSKYNICSKDGISLSETVLQYFSQKLG